MNFVKRLRTFSAPVLIGLMTFALSSCGGNPSSTTGGGNKPSSSNGNTPNSSVQKPEETGIFSIADLKNDLVTDSDGNVVFDDPIELKIWSIIGDPDRVVFQQLIDKFNDEYLGQIHLNVVYQGHFDYYTALESTWKNDKNSFPDICFMHNERTVEYAYKGYLYPLDQVFNSEHDKYGHVDIDFSNIYENIDQVTHYKDYRFALPVDAHGFLTQFRQDIIKKNGLGFDDNTRYIPNSRAEYQSLLEGLRAKADAGTLLIRNINRGEDHSWKTASKDTFYPEFIQSTDPDGLSALYANGGRLINDAQDQILFQNNEGFKTYLTDQVDRYNNRLMGESGTNVEMFGQGRTVMFSEGPWWVAQTYTGSFNNSELKRAGEKGVTAEDAADPVINSPYVASRPTSWWTLDEYEGTETGSKWYGNGHAISITRHVTSLQSAAAALTFMKWYTQSTDIDSAPEDEAYNLTTWCTTGHIPAWKNVYESKSYESALANSVTLKALGNPADVIAMEGLEYESTVFGGVGNAVTAVQNALKSSTVVTKESALKILEESSSSTQAALDLLKMFE